MVDVTAESIGQLRDLRASSPGSIADLLLKRKRRPLLGADGRLFIVAADHPARGSLGVRDNAMAMASRIDLLRRLVVALDRPGVDGVLGTPDIIEDLALLGALDDKVVVGSMNRGGLRGSTFEIDDRFTGYNVKTIVDGGLDFAKLLVRIDLQDRATADTLEHTARAVTKSAENHVPIMLEPFMCRRSDGLVVNDLSTEAVITSIAIASGLGASSAYSWLKVPVVDDMERVIDASTLPTLLLGGDSDTSSDETFASWQNALTLPGVRGLVVGRSLLYPADDDVALAVDTAAGLVHERVRAL